MTTHTAEHLVDIPVGPQERPGRGPEERPGWGPLLVMLTGTFMTFLDFFIVNVALPSMQGQLHASPAAIQFVVAGFGLTFAVGLISGGRLGDIYGRRRAFSVGLGLFTVASAACGLAPSAAFLVAARTLQGGAAALMTPQVLATLGTAYTGDKRARAFAAYGLTMGLAGVLGQLIGGGLIALDIAGAGWRSIFLINVPVGLAALTLVRRLVPESRGERAGLDLTGTALVTAGLTAVVLPLVEGRQQGWPVWTWLTLASAPVLIAAFVAHQRARAAAGRAPLVRLTVFRDRTFAVGTLTAVTFGGIPASFFFVLALYLQDGRHLSALSSGIVFTGVGVGYFTAMLLAGRIAARLGRHVLTIGAACLTVACLVLAVSSGASTSLALLPGLALAGFGIGLVLVPLTAIALANLTAGHAGAASGVLSTALQVGGALGIAVVGVVFFGALPGGGFAHALTVSLLAIAVPTVATAALTRLLPLR